MENHLVDSPQLFYHSFAFALICWGRICAFQINPFKFEGQRHRHEDYICVFLLKLVIAEA